MPPRIYSIDECPHRIPTNARLLIDGRLERTMRNEYLGLLNIWYYVPNARQRCVSFQVREVGDNFYILERMLAHLSEGRPRIIVSTFSLTFSEAFFQRYWSFENPTAIEDRPPLYCLRRHGSAPFLARSRRNEIKRILRRRILNEENLNEISFDAYVLPA